MNYEVKVLGRDETGRIVAESDGMRYYLTECCRASAKGSSNSPTGVCCRSCYRAIEPGYGGLPDQTGPVADPFPAGVSV